ncbi:MAG: MEDS domain-containing protein [Thermotogota bacterium]|nr:MEDS domain-containing protein [Thermotogota bacterium]
MENFGYRELCNYDLKELLKKLKPHDHLCLLYEDRDVWADTIVRFIHEGLKQNQKCIYVADENTAREIRDIFSDKDIDISKYENNGQFVITSERDTYTRNGHFDPDSMINLLISETEKAIEEGYDALRVTGEMTWALRGIKGSGKILEYEAKLNRDLFPNYPCTAIWQYDIRKSDPEIIKGVLLTHPLVVKDRKIYRNFYYIEPKEFLNQKKSERQVKQWLNNLEREKRSLETIKNQKEEYETTFNSLNEGVILQKNTGEILSMNESAEKILGIKKENVIGKSSVDYKWNMIKENGEDFPPEEHPSIYTLKTGKPCKDKVMGQKNKDGSITWINVNTNPVFSKNKKAPDRVVISFSNITKRKKAEEKLNQIKWMLNTRQSKKKYSDPPYGNLTELNKSGLILKSVGEDILKEIATDYLGLLETSASIYEKNGDYALGIFSSGWCRFLHSSSRALCKTKDNREALKSGKWLCHECCWNEAAKPAIESGKPTDIACEGGIRLYTVPIWANNKVIGAMNFGYGDPPKDEDTLNDIAKKYSVDINELKKKADEYKKRPPFIIDLAKERLHSLERLIGAVVEKNQVMEELKAINTRLQLAYEGAGLGIWDQDFKTNKVVRTGNWYKMLGYNPEEIDEMVDAWKELIHPEDKERVEKVVQKTNDGVTDEFKVSHRLRCKSGEYKWVLNWGRVIERGSNGKPLRSTGIHIDIDKLRKTQEELKESMNQLKSITESAIKALASAVDLRDPYTAGHQRRVAQLAVAIVNKMQLDPERIDALRLAALVHDAGKIKVPSEILNKPCKLSDLEFSLIKEHPTAGWKLFRDIEITHPLAEIIYQHHERLDGSGYPRGLKDKEILLESKILAVADVVEAMSSHRPYRQALGIETALEEIEKNAGKLYDQEVVKICVKLFREEGFAFKD